MGLESLKTTNYDFILYRSVKENTHLRTAHPDHLRYGTDL